MLRNEDEMLVCEMLQSNCGVMVITAAQKLANFGLLMM